MPDDLPAIPTVDLGDLVHHEASVRRAAATQILEGFGTYGLIYVLGHGVDPELRDRVFDQFVAFTDRPRAEKEPLNRPDLWFQRGWTPPNTERAVLAAGQPDFKECYFAAPREMDPTLRIEHPEICADNVWPEGIDGFEADYMALGQQLHEAGAVLLMGVAMALGLEDKIFDSRIEGGPHVFRLLRYLPLTAAQVAEKVVWGEEHTDFNVLTLLPGGRFLDPSGKPCERPDTASGLYLRTRATEAHPHGQMVQGVAPAGCIVAQVGQQLEILSGGSVLATPHVITAPTTPGYTRVSAAHFIHLHSHQLVCPLPQFRTPATIEAYRPPVLAGTYAIKTLVDIGLAPPSALDQLGYRQYGRLSEIRAAEGSPSSDAS